MPELPEVETMRRGIAAITGSRILDVRTARCRKRPITLAPALAVFRRRARGRTIVEVGRLGKRVLLRLDDDAVIVIEPRMTGLVLLSDPPTREHLRLRFVLDGPHEELLFWDRRGLGVVRLMSKTEFEQLLGAARIGPDALTMKARMLEQRLATSRRAIKVALLDQRALAGIGNLYAAEILHRAAIHPQRQCHRLQAADWQRLDRAIKAVLRAAIRGEGSTLGDGTYRNALNQPGNYQKRHRVYGRAGQLCPVCRRGSVERIVQAQRSTFFCAVCQPLRGK